MFDLERAICDWRASMMGSMPGRSIVVDELESHLRDAVQRNIQSGQAIEDAWNAAIQQLGTPQVISHEFGKLPQPKLWLSRATWGVAGLYLILAVITTLGLVRGFVAGRISSLLLVHVWSIALGYSAMLAVGLIATWSILSRALSGWSAAETTVLSKTFRLAAMTSLVLTIVGVASGGIWLRQTRGDLWQLDFREMAGLCLVGWNAVALWNLMRHSSERSRLVMGLVGCGLTGLAWMGPMLLTSVISYGQVEFVAIVIIVLGSLTLSVSLLVVLALLPPGRLRFSEIG